MEDKKLDKLKNITALIASITALIMSMTAMYEAFDKTTQKKSYEILSSEIELLKKDNQRSSRVVLHTLESISSNPNSQKTVPSYPLPVPIAIDDEQKDLPSWEDLTKTK